MNGALTNAFSIDVEDWFHILDVDQAYAMDAWPSLESRVEENTERLLELLGRTGTRCTCFLLGWVLERCPQLARRIAEAGHEIASHGYGHELIYEIGPERFRADLQRSIDLIEEVLDVRPVGYRAPGFSITHEATWALDILAELGMKYDSSLFPAPRSHGGILGVSPLPNRLELTDGRSLMEFPITTLSVLGRRIAYCGGGYLRFFPYWYIRSRISAANRRGEPVIVYIHPRDIDPDQPRMRLPLARRYKSYVNLQTTFRKLESLVRDFRFASAAEVLGIQ